MIKELILAIALGALLGFGLTGGYIAVKRNNNPTPAALSPTPTTNNTTAATPSPLASSTATDDQAAITIDSPEDKSIVSESTLTIKGTASPQSRIIITSAVDNYFGQSDDSGHFSIIIELESGPNLLEINSISTDDSQTSVPLMVTYSTAKI